MDENIEGRKLMKYWIVWIENNMGRTIDYYFQCETEDEAYIRAMEQHDHDLIDTVEEITEEEFEEHEAHFRFN